MRSPRLATGPSPSSPLLPPVIVLERADVCHSALPGRVFGYTVRDAGPASRAGDVRAAVIPYPSGRGAPATSWPGQFGARSEEHTSELQSLMRISYAVFCLKKKNR